MYGIKVWSSEKDNDWYLLKDMNDGVIHVWDKKEEVEQAQKKFKLQTISYYQNYVKCDN